MREVETQSSAGFFLWTDRLWPLTGHNISQNLNDSTSGIYFIAAGRVF